MPAADCPDLEGFIEALGNPADPDYLRQHYGRFCLTRQIAARHWQQGPAKVLDIGAHWLHQAALWSMAGHTVTAADLPVTLNAPHLRPVAEKFNIGLHRYADLDSRSALDGIDDNAFDIVLFTEIIEHITFNPVAMWQAIYRVLRPGGRIIITTPNFYAGTLLLRSVPRFIVGRGSGIPVEQILHKHTRAPHWKEFSMRELRHYFELLSADFRVGVSRYLAIGRMDHQQSTGKRWAYALIESLPILRNGLYLEVDLPQKRAGIRIEPRW